MDKCIYDFVQAVREYYKKAMSILKNVGFMGASVYPCLIGGVRKELFSLLIMCMIV